MALTGTRTFVGFGFGAIQSGLFLYEAFHSGAFRRLIVAEIVPEVVTAVQKERGNFCVNIAHRDQVESARVGPIEIYNPAVESDRQNILAAIVEAEEIATAVPSVAFYTSDQPGSIHRMLADGLCQKVERDGPRVVVYVAENHNHAAEVLEAAVMELIPQDQHPAVHSRVRFLNTVIGKMSQIVTDPSDILERNLTQITPELQRAFLVESFNHILISKIQFPEVFERGIQVFQEKNELLPFEEAKLYGHNATHALLGYLGFMLGAQRVADLQKIPGILPFARAAFIEESGATLIRKHTGVDKLFTPDGYKDFCDDLLERMINPFLVDMIERVTRDTERKLGWTDRLIGTMRVALQQNINPYRYAIGAAAALVHIEPAILKDKISIENTLDELWREDSPNEFERNQVVGLIENALEKLHSWHMAGFPDLEIFYNQINK